jgi:UDP-N-acetylglucosamine acyltransferase
VAPFVIVAGDRARVRGLNRVGLERAVIPDGSRRALEAAYRILWRSRQPLSTALRAARADVGEDPQVRRLLDFVAAAIAG